MPLLLAAFASAAAAETGDPVPVPPAGAEAPVTLPLLHRESNCGWSHCGPYSRTTRSESVQGGLRECGVREEDSYHELEVGYVARLPRDFAAAAAVTTCLLSNNVQGAVDKIERAASFMWNQGRHRDAVSLQMLLLRHLVADYATMERPSGRRYVDDTAHGPEYVGNIIRDVRAVNDLDRARTAIRALAGKIRREAATDSNVLTAEERGFVTATARFQQDGSTVPPTLHRDTLELRIRNLRIAIADRESLERTSRPKREIDLFDQHVRNLAERALSSATEDGVAMTAQERAFLTEALRSGQEGGGD